MQCLIESLEGRRLLSGVTAVTLANDDTLIVNDSTALKTAMANLFSIEASDDLAIENAVLALGLKSNIPLGKKAVAAEKSGASALTRDVNALVKGVEKDASKALAAGDALLLNPTSKAALSKVNGDIRLLNTSIGKPLTKVQTDLASTKVDDDLNVIATTNPSAMTVQTTITTRETQGSAQTAVVSTAATQVQTDVQAMVTDLESIGS